MRSQAVIYFISRATRHPFFGQPVVRLKCQSSFSKYFHSGTSLRSNSVARVAPNLSNPALETYVKNFINNMEQSRLNVSEKSNLLQLWTSREKLIDDVSQLKAEIAKDSSQELKELAAEEMLDLQQKIAAVDNEILNFILPSSSSITARVQSCFLEVTAGVGGQEAMLFAAEMIAMYENFIVFNGWEKDITEIDKSEMGGLRHGSIAVSGKGAFEALGLEAGVHRVQRVPKTEKNGRVHTSTVSVAVLPQPTDVQINIAPKDLKIETKRASGAGGQHVNTTDSCVRIVHLPTGLAFESQSERSQIQNRASAMQKLRAKLFQIEIERQELETRSARKKQVGSSFRSEKIRTYNFPQDRITDHRIGKSVHNIRNFMLGGEILAEFIEDLKERKKEEELEAFVASLD